jgi:hypothetical protein
MDLYNKDRDVIALGQFYTDHVSAMTREGLHAKSDIAAELAYRDQRIAALEAKLAEYELAASRDAKRKLTPHQRIMRAAERGTGVRLTADEALALSMDTAIGSCAENDDAEQEECRDERP